MKRLLVASAILASACNPYKPPAAPEPRDATRVNASLGHTWDAVIDKFAACTIPIRTIERVSGIIVTDQLTVGSEGRKWANCGKAGAVTYRPNFGSYNVLVRGDSSSSTVKTTVRWVYAEVKGPPIECSTTHVWEREFEEGVKEQAEAAPNATHDSSNPPPAASEPPAPTTQAVQVQPAVGGRDAVPASVAPADSSGDSKAPRSRAPRALAADSALLRDPVFASAIADLRGLNAIDGFSETGQDTLTVQLTDMGIGSPATTHYLRQLFSAYRSMNDPSPDPVLVLTHRGRVAGTYTQVGLSKKNWR